MPPAVVRFFCAAWIAALAACAPAPKPALNPFFAEVPPTTITAIVLRKSGCFGSCAAFTVRFAADGRATYEGERFAPRQGRFSGLADFERLAAWVDTQHPEMLAPGYAQNIVDSQHVTLRIERGATVQTIDTADEPRAPLRLEGLVLALEAATARVGWRREDAYTALLGPFAHAGATLSILDRSGRLALSGTALQQCRDPEVIRVRDRLRLFCEGRTSTLRATAAGLAAEGTAIQPGAYRRVTWREASHRIGQYGATPDPE